MPIERFSADATPEALAAALARDGVAIVERLVAPAVMDRARHEIAPFLDATAPGSDAFAGTRTRRTGALIARSPTCRELVMHPLVRATVGRVLAKATSFQLHLTQLIAIGPGEPAQLVHRDQWAFDFYPFAKDYEVQCNTIWAMSDFTAENGATRVVPGSNLLDDGLRFAEADTLPAEMEKGSVVLYTGRLYHGGGANRSAETRYGVNLTYAVSWLRQEENQYLSVPLDVARTLPVELLRLMGYARGAYALGYVDDTRDPLDVLFPGRGDAGLGALEAANARAKPRSAVVNASSQHRPKPKRPLPP